MSEQTTSLGDRVDAETAIGILTACGQDVDIILECIPPSKRSGRFNKAIESLRSRISVGEELRKARHGY